MTNIKARGDPYVRILRVLQTRKSVRLDRLAKLSHASAAAVEGTITRLAEYGLADVACLEARKKQSSIVTLTSEGERSIAVMLLIMKLRKSG
jgi:hypothetical protein